MPVRDFPRPDKVAPQGAPGAHFTHFLARMAPAIARWSVHQWGYYHPSPKADVAGRRPGQQAEIANPKGRAPCAGAWHGLFTFYTGAGDELSRARTFVLAAIDVQKEIKREKKAHPSDWAPWKRTELETFFWGECRSRVPLDSRCRIFSARERQKWRNPQAQLLPEHAPFLILRPNRPRVLRRAKPTDSAGQCLARHGGFAAIWTNLRITHKFAEVMAGVCARRGDDPGAGSLPGRGRAPTPPPQPRTTCAPPDSRPGRNSTISRRGSARPREARLELDKAASGSTMPAPSRFHDVSRNGAQRGKSVASAGVSGNASAKLVEVLSPGPTPRPKAARSGVRRRCFFREPRGTATDTRCPICPEEPYEDTSCRSAAK